jgi:tetratricopeptide (TPR) repeat protein
MKIRKPLLNIRSAITGSVLGGLLFIASVAAAASIDEQFNQVEFKLSLIKLDILRLYQTGAIGADRSPPSSSSRTSANPVLKRENQKSPGSFQGAVNLKEIAALMKRLEPAADSAASSKGSGQPPADETRLLLADYFFQANLISRAEQMWKEIAIQTRREPIAAEAWFRLEKLYYRKGEYQQALGAFYKIPEKSKLPLQQEAAYLAGNSYLYMKDYLKATEWLAKVDKGDDFYPFALYSSGLAYLNRKDAESSAQLKFKKLIALNPGEDPVLRELINRARVTLGFILIDQKQFEDAVKLFGSVSPHSRYRPQAQSGIGRAYMEMEKCVTAIVVLNDLIEQAPAQPYALEARLHVGNCFSKLSAYRKAVESYQNALRIYTEQKDNIMKRTRQIQAAGLENGPFKSGAKATGKGRQPDALEANLEALPNGQRLLDVYADWSRLDEQIRGQDRLAETLDRQKTGLSQGPYREPIEIQMQNLYRQLEELYRTAATDELSSEAKQVDDLIIWANVGIAKNTIMMQDYGFVPQ